VAARALARHPQAAAGKALPVALAQPDPAIAIAAADALLLRADGQDCPALRAKLISPYELVRYHVIQAAGRLGCIGPDALELFAERDQSEDIRGLAAALLEARVPESRNVASGPRPAAPDRPWRRSAPAAWRRRRG
jgi:hypothetical protein